MFKYLLWAIPMIVMLATCSSPKNSTNQNEETLRKFLISNGFEHLIPDTSRTNFWRDTIRLDKYNLTIYTHDMTGLDGSEYRFFVEDSLNDVYVLHRSGWFPPLTDYYPRKLAFDRILDSIPIFEPFEYDYQDLEEYFNRSRYFRTHSLDLDLLDTIIKHDQDFKKDGFVVKDSVQIFKLLDSRRLKLVDSVSIELKKIIRVYLKKKFARLYVMPTEYEWKVLYIDFDPYYLGDIELTNPDGTKNRQHIDKSIALRSNSLTRRINMRFIRFEL